MQVTPSIPGMHRSSSTASGSHAVDQLEHLVARCVALPRTSMPASLECQLESREEERMIVSQDDSRHS